MAQSTNFFLKYTEKQTEKHFLVMISCIFASLNIVRFAPIAFFKFMQLQHECILTSLKPTISENIKTDTSLLVHAQG